MSTVGRFFFSQLGAQAPAIVVIRIAVGLIFTTQGVLKYIDPNMGVNRFIRIGFPHPWFTAHFVGAFEIVCGCLVLIGVFTRLAAVDGWPGRGFRTPVTPKGAPPEPVLLGWGISAPCFCHLLF